MDCRNESGNAVRGFYCFVTRGLVPRAHWAPSVEPDAAYAGLRSSVANAVPMQRIEKPAETRKIRFGEPWSIITP